jgi:hypothetical protein
MVVKSGASNVGFIRGYLVIEYPIWSHLRHNMESMPKITYQEADSIQPQIEQILVPKPIFHNDEAYKSKLYVFGRNKSDRGQWDILYPLGIEND